MMVLAFKIFIQHATWLAQQCSTMLPFFEQTFVKRVESE
jgi:hypothetical protein